MTRYHDRSESPVRYRDDRRGSPLVRRKSIRTSISPVKISPRRKERSPTRAKSSHRARYSKVDEFESPPRSGSPPFKSSRREKDGRDVERRREKEYERNGGGRDLGRGKNREKGYDREPTREEGDRRTRRGDRIEAMSCKRRHDHSASPKEHRRREKQISRSPAEIVRNGSHEEGRASRRSDQDRSGNDSLSKMKAAEEALEAKQKQKPSFELSGKLAAETNRVRGITLLFNEPPEARKPDIRWRLYVFKAGEVLNEPLYIHRQSCYLFGRERRVADIPTDHPSCSKQHAVIQFRQVEKEQSDGMFSKQTRPYVMDLGSTNKTFLNDNPIEPQRYYELFEKDTIRFGNSSREYVLLNENST